MQIIGGAGNDLIYGDFDGDIAVYANNNTWDYSIDKTTDESGDTTYTANITGISMTDTTADGAGSDDVIYGGTGKAEPAATLYWATTPSAISYSETATARWLPSSPTETKRRTTA